MDRGHVSRCSRKLGLTKLQNLQDSKDYFMGFPVSSGDQIMQWECFVFQ